MTTVLTVSIPEAGRLVGLGRFAAYEAARRGEIPTVTFGRRKLVPVRALESLLELEPGTLTKEDFEVASLPHFSSTSEADAAHQDASDGGK